MQLERTTSQQNAEGGKVGTIGLFDGLPEGTPEGDSLGAELGSWEGDSVGN